MIWGHKWSSSIPDDYIEATICEWKEGLKDIPPDAIKGALNYCRINLEWPPSIAEFRKHCKKSLGIPDIDQIIQGIIRRDFSHPIMEEIYKRVGSWSFSNDSEKILKKKVKSAYDECNDSFVNVKLLS
jgi:hypothetical protein